MNPKVAKFFPLTIAGLAVLRELINIIFFWHFNLINYITYDLVETRYGFGNFLYTFFIFLLRANLIIGALLIVKMYLVNKIVVARLMSGVLIPVYFLPGLLRPYFGSYFFHHSLVSYILGGLISILLIVNFVISLVAKDANALARTPKFNQHNVPPIPFLPQSSANTQSSSQSVADQLAAVKKMHKSGDLTDAEFKAAKKKILE